MGLWIISVERDSVTGVSGSSCHSQLCWPILYSSNFLKWFQGFSSKLWSRKQTWAAAVSAALLKTGQFQVLICPRISIQTVIAKIFRRKHRWRRNSYIFMPCLQTCSEKRLFFTPEINCSKSTQSLQKCFRVNVWESATHLLCSEFIKTKFELWSQISVHSGDVLVRLTYTSGQYVTPHSSASSQTCDLAASLKSVAMETREGQWVTDSEPESRPPAESRYAGILARLQVVFCSETDRSVEEVRRSSKEWR